jgi:hypothetical protein
MRRKGSAIWGLLREERAKLPQITTALLYRFSKTL